MLMMAYHRPKKWVSFLCIYATDLSSYIKVHELKTLQELKNIMDVADPFNFHGEVLFVVAINCVYGGRRQPYWMNYKLESMIRNWNSWKQMKKKWEVIYDKS